MNKYSRLIYSGVLVIGFLLFPNALKAETRFFESLYDVPIMQGLSEIPDMSLSFDKPSGRIAQAGAVGEDVPKSKIEDFYQISLSQLGWRLVNPNIYRREREELQIFFDKSPYSANGVNIVRFTLKPVE